MLGHLLRFLNNHDSMIYNHGTKFLIFLYLKISRNIISFIRSKELNHFNLQQNNKKESRLKLWFRTELGSYILYFSLLLGKKKKIIPIAVLHHPRKLKRLWGFCTADLVINKFFYPKWHCLVAQNFPCTYPLSWVK